MAMTKPAIAFLQEHGHKSLVSLGCGRQINRIDNHIRLMIALNLNYYVGIDCGPWIEPVSPNLFVDPDGVTELLSGYYQGKPRKFRDAIKVFPETWVEELKDIHCAVVVCQRVYPDCRWEEVIFSMTPKLVLQEDLHGCERQQLRGKKYVRTWAEKKYYGLRPYKPWPIFPGEYNLLLWRRRDFQVDGIEEGRWKTLRRLREWVIG
ncbi:MAG: hypothetical protein GWN14_13610 [candidate division Zixibacteria bacterium]|nr:hypothetical protein [Gammaproteobacteria bacterium]NIX56920.1 hypothetical protein [candidate division Zixibacteria bacterium]